MHMGTTTSTNSRAWKVAGSPPCTWGQRFSNGPASLDQRFTPMHMGTTATPDSATLWPTVHPHAHGDNWWFPSLEMDQRGSPPCTWGQRDGGSRCGCHDRFTPMHMGTTRLSRVFPCGLSVHPHAHGDNGFRHLIALAFGGSPPCTWGQRRRSPRSPRPAAVHPHAHGDNGTARRRSSPATVHPHAHGDNQSSCSSAQGQTGSPPCTWGQLIGADFRTIRNRFTPMHMGTTFILSVNFCCTSVHPHAHGDNAILAVAGGD